MHNKSRPSGLVESYGILHWAEQPTDFTTATASSAPQGPCLMTRTVPETRCSRLPRRSWTSASGWSPPSQTCAGADSWYLPLTCSGISLCAYFLSTDSRPHQSDHVMSHAVDGNPLLACSVQDRTVSQQQQQEADGISYCTDELEGHPFWGWWGPNHLTRLLRNSRNSSTWRSSWSSEKLSHHL